MNTVPSVVRNNRLGYQLPQINYLQEPTLDLINHWDLKCAQIFHNGDSLSYYDKVQGQVKDFTWIVHSIMSRFIAPKDSLRWLCKDYLKRALIQLSEKKIPYFVIHVGATKDLEIKEVQQQLDKMMTYSRLGESSLSEFLEDPKITTKILVENVACVAPFNSTLKPLMESLSKYPKLGWVLDTHHAYAAGIPEEEISQAVANNQPDVIHLNFYNAPKGSGKDRHGWRSGQNGLKLSEKKHNITDSDIDFWDNFAKEQFIKGTPLILEGSKEKDSSMELEIEFLKTKILS